MALQVAKGVQTGGLDLPADRTISKYLLHRSRGLVEVVLSRNGYVVQFIHETVREFLRRSSDRKAYGPSMESSIAISNTFGADDCHISIAEECLQYLLNLGSNGPRSANDTSKDFLAKYAAEYWWQHFRSGNRRCTEQFFTLVEQLLLSEANLSHWVHYYDIDDHDFPTLYYAASVGVTEIVSALLRRNFDIHSGGGAHNTPLQAASYHGHEAIVQLLIDRGADMNAYGGVIYGNALQLASWNGHEAVVKLLVERGADVNAQNSRYGSALQLASWNGYEQVVRFLAEKGAHINAQDGEYPSALQGASINDHENIVRFLVDSGADMDAQNQRYSTALQWASLKGHENVVQALIEKKVNVNVRTGGQYGSALQAASFNGYVKIVQSLLEKGADPNGRDRYQATALQMAAANGHQRCVELLIEKGANIHAHGEELYGNALQAASRTGRKRIVQILIEAGADINALDRSYGSPLQGASKYGWIEVVQLLIEHGADVNAKKPSQDSALVMASKEGHDQIMKILVDNGAVGSRATRGTQTVWSFPPDLAFTDTNLYQTGRAQSNLSTDII